MIFLITNNLIVNVKIHLIHKILKLKLLAIIFKIKLLNNIISKYYININLFTRNIKYSLITSKM